MQRIRWTDMVHIICVRGAGICERDIPAFVYTAQGAGINDDREFQYAGSDGDARDDVKHGV